MPENKDKEFDQSLLEYNLSLSPEERLINHQRNFEIVQELQKAHKEIYAEPEQPSQDPT